MHIQVDPSRLETVSGDIRTTNHDLNAVMDSIEWLVLSTNGVWQGDAERAFAEKILYVKRQFAAISSFFDDYAQLLNSFATDYEQQDADLSAIIHQA